MRVEVGDVLLDLTPEQAESLRRQLGVAHPDSPQLVDAAEMARRVGVSRDCIYARAAELGAVRLGCGPKARLRFDPAIVAERLAGSSAPDTERSEPVSSRRRRSGLPERDLLPIRGARP